MSLPWVAGAVRARLLLGRRLGRRRALEAAACRTLDDALPLVAAGGYLRDVQAAPDLAAAQRAVAGTLLLRLRVLAAWLPPEGAIVLRVLAAWFELVNIEDRLAYLLGGPLRRPFELGGLSTAWNALAQAQSPGELRTALARSAWGDPRSEAPERVHFGLRLAWAERVAATAPEVARLADGAVALLVARELFAAGRPPELLASRRIRGLGTRWQDARTLPELIARLPVRASWALAGVERADDLWRGELAWWREAERAGVRLLRESGESRQGVVGASLLLAADAQRASAALGLAALGRRPELEEAFAATA